MRSWLSPSRPAFIAAAWLRLAAAARPLASESTLADSLVPNLQEKHLYGQAPWTEVPEDDDYSQASQTDEWSDSKLKHAMTGAQSKYHATDTEHRLLVGHRSSWMDGIWKLVKMARQPLVDAVEVQESETSPKGSRCCRCGPSFDTPLDTVIWSHSGRCHIECREIFATQADEKFFPAPKNCTPSGKDHLWRDEKKKCRNLCRQIWYEAEIPEVAAREPCNGLGCEHQVLEEERKMYLMEAKSFKPSSKPIPLPPALKQPPLGPTKDNPDFPVEAAPPAPAPPYVPEEEEEEEKEEEEQQQAEEKQAKAEETEEQKEEEKMEEEEKSELPVVPFVEVKDLPPAENDMQQLAVVCLISILPLPILLCLPLRLLPFLLGKQIEESSEEQSSSDS